MIGKGGKRGFSVGRKSRVDPSVYPLSLYGKECLSPYLPKLLKRFGAI
jgi:hypothetical protein